jgi:hypothetical protein
MVRAFLLVKLPKNTNTAIVISKHESSAQQDFIKRAQLA